MGLDSEKNIDSRFWNLLMKKDFMEKIIFLKDEKEVMAEFEKEGVNPTDEEIKTLKSFLLFIWNKLKECSSEEIEEIKKIGNNLTDEDLEAVSGGTGGVVGFAQLHAGSQVIEAPSKIAAQSALAGAQDKFQAFTGQRHKLGTELGKTVEQAGEAVNQGGISTDWAKNPSKVSTSGGSVLGKLGGVVSSVGEGVAAIAGNELGRWAADKVIDAGVSLFNRIRSRGGSKSKAKASAQAVGKFKYKTPTKVRFKGMGKYGPETKPVSKPVKTNDSAWAEHNKEHMMYSTTSAKEKAVSKKAVGASGSAVSKPEVAPVSKPAEEKGNAWAVKNLQQMSGSKYGLEVATRSKHKPAKEKNTSLSESNVEGIFSSDYSPEAWSMPESSWGKSSTWAEQNTGSMTHSRAQAQLAPGSNPDPQPGGGEKTTDYAKASAKDKPEDEKEKSKTKTARKTLGLKPLAALAALFGGSKLAKEDSGKNRRSNRRDKEEKEEKRKSEEKQQEEKKTNNYDNIKSGAAVAAAVAMLAIAHMDEIKDFYKKNIGPNIDPIKENLNKHISNIKTWFNT